MGDSDADSQPIPVPSDLVIATPDRLTWGTVTTARAPLLALARFAAHHLDLGAGKVTLYLDEPDCQASAYFAGFDRVRVITCDPDYWLARGRTRPQTHQLRQAYNATRCYRDSGLHWLAHLDVDEFLLPAAPVNLLLATAPVGDAFVQMAPAELLSQPDPFHGLAHFKLTRTGTGHPKSVLCDIYPEFGAYVPEGFLSHTSGKIFARTGLGDLRLGIHALLRCGVRVANGRIDPRLHVGHAHAPDRDVFLQHLPFRRAKGSYRRKDFPGMHLQDVLDVIEEAEGTAGLHRLYDELNRATPRLIAALDRHAMLLSATLDLDEKVMRWFGQLPEPSGTPS